MDVGTGRPFADDEPLGKVVCARVQAACTAGVLGMKKPIAFLVMVLGLMGLIVADLNTAVAAERGGGGRSAGAPGGGGGRGFAAPAGRGGGGGHQYARSRGHSGGHSHGHSHSHWSLGLSFGAPFWYGPAYYPYYYPYPYPYPYYYPPAVVVTPEPRVYVERDDRPSDSGQSSPWWYYCRESDMYYPYVKECAGQWERVPAQPQ